MKPIVLSILFICFSLALSAQITDEPNESTSIPAVEKNQTVDVSKDGSSITLNQESESLALPIKKYTDSFDLTSKKKGFTMIHDSNLVNPGVIYEEKWAKKEKESRAVFQGDQFLGQFDTKSVFIHVLYRDHEYPDGDRIRVYLNDDVIRPNVLLTQGYGGFKLDLKEGINKLDFQALNQGESGPNTAEFQVYDDNENLVSSNRWNLA
ncbi:MAG: hypothetical protein KJN66_00595, partial [Bacteroidia bacterium]|nr:hypothetical protein [Bacteroidia bacterium]